MSISTVLVYVAILIALGLAVTVTFSAADKYRLLDLVKKSRAAPRETSCTPRPLSRGE